MNKSLIIGGTGNIGTSLVNTFKDKGKDFRVLIRDDEKKLGLEAKGIECVLGDYTIADDVINALDGCNQLFLLTRADFVMDHHEEDILTYAEERDVSYVVYVSAVAVTTDPDTRLAVCHQRVEDILKESRMDWTILRPHSFMQNLLGHISTVKDHGAMYGTLGSEAIPLIDARDIGEAAAILLSDPSEHREKTLLLTGKEKITHKEIAQVMSEVLKKNVSYVQVEDVAAKSAMIQAGLPEWLVDDLLALNNAWKAGKDTDVSTTLESILGRTPNTFLDFFTDHKFLFQ